MAPNEPAVQGALVVDKAGEGLAVSLSRAQSESAFQSFIERMPGKWNSERTYHYLAEEGYGPSGRQGREESQTSFDVGVLSPDQIDAVLASNATSNTASLADWQRAVTYGFRVSFRTLMRNTNEYVTAGTNLAFVPQAFHANGLITGDYFRDLGYEEKAPVKARFVFDVAKAQLVMTTTYSRVVSVDSITLVSPDLRLRQIVNYKRPADGQALSDVVLTGFGVEARGLQEQKPLVE